MRHRCETTWGASARHTKGRSLEVKSWYNRCSQVTPQPTLVPSNPIRAKLVLKLCGHHFLYTHFPVASCVAQHARRLIRRQPCHHDCAAHHLRNHPCHSDSHVRANHASSVPLSLTDDRTAILLPRLPKNRDNEKSECRKKRMLNLEHACKSQIFRDWCSKHESEHPEYKSEHPIWYVLSYYLTIVGA